MEDFDPRTTPARPDLAAKHLQGKVKAARFAEGKPRTVRAPQAPLRKAPSPDAPLETEALRGECVHVYEETEEGWCWVQLEDDGYVGFMPSQALAPPAAEATHRVSALRTLMFASASIKTQPLDSLPLGSKLAIDRIEGNFAVTADGEYIPCRHLKALKEYEADFVEVAQRFVGTPYLWGGKTNLGIDCSGLVQVALTAAGLKCPRDSDMQEKTVGQLLPRTTDPVSLRRGDLIFWAGHVAIVFSATRILHANAFHMAVVIEPLAEAVARISAMGSEIRSIRRIEGLAWSPAEGYFDGLGQGGGVFGLKRKINE